MSLENNGHISIRRASETRGSFAKTKAIGDLSF